jgi:hypothetical protein
MDSEAQNTIAATMMAHEMALATLLAFYFKKLSDEQRRSIEESMATPPDITGLFAEYDLDIGTHDDIAGLAMLYRDAMNRVHKRALAIADHLNAKGGQGR